MTPLNKYFHLLHNNPGLPVSSSLCSSCSHIRTGLELPWCNPAANACCRLDLFSYTPFPAPRRGRIKQRRIWVRREVPNLCINTCLNPAAGVIWRNWLDNTVDEHEWSPARLPRCLVFAVCVSYSPHIKANWCNSIDDHDQIRLNYIGLEPWWRCILTVEMWLLPENSPSLDPAEQQQKFSTFGCKKKFPWQHSLVHQ